MPSTFAKLAQDMGAGTAVALAFAARHAAVAVVLAFPHLDVQRQAQLAQRKETVRALAQLGVGAGGQALGHKPGRARLRRRRAARPHQRFQQWSLGPCMMWPSATDSVISWQPPSTGVVLRAVARAI